MLRDEVLTILKQQEKDLSGEEISRRLGVTRMAVSNAVKALRKEGYVIDSATNRGYRLLESPDKLSSGDLFAHLPEERQQTVRCFDRIDSTNSYLKREQLLFCRRLRYLSFYPVSTELRAAKNHDADSARCGCGL